MNGNYSSLPDVKLIQFIITDLSKVLYLNTSNSLYQMSRD